MIVGVTPYYSSNKDELFDNIVNGKLKLPRNISAEVKSLIIQLLNRNPVKRLGSKPGEQGADQIMSHPFFQGINWDDVMAKKSSFKPNKPKYRLQDYIDVITETEYTSE
jgi:serine/threonine protein kinase